MDQPTSAASAGHSLSSTPVDGLSVQWALACLNEHGHLPALDLDWPTDSREQEHVRGERLALCRRLGTLWQSLADHAGLPALRLVQRPLWSSRWQSQLLQASRQLQLAAEQTLTHAEQLRQQLGLPALGFDRRSRIALAVLTRSLPQARGQNWRFVLRPDGDAVCTRLRHSLGLLQRLRQTESLLSPGWSAAQCDQVQDCLDRLQQLRDGLNALPAAWPAELYSAMVHGVGLLSTHVETAGQLAAQYTPEVSRLDLEQLLYRWEQASHQVWPASWMGRRRVLALLRRSIEGQRQTPSDVGAELRRLMRLRQLAAELARLEPLSSHVEPPWPDLRQPLQEARAAVTVQCVLRQARSGGSWSVVGLPALAADPAHGALAETAGRLCELHALQLELERRAAGLGALTGKLWRGLRTDLPQLRALLACQRALLAARADQPWRHADLEPAARGDCGPAAAADLQRLEQCDQIRTELALCSAGLDQASDGLWRGLASDIGQIERTLKFQGSINAAIATLATGPDAAATIRHALQQVLAPGSMLLTPTGSLATGGRGYMAQLSQLQSALDTWAAHLPADRTLQNALDEASLDTLMTHAHELQQSAALLPLWCQWHQSRAEAIGAGLGPLLQALNRGLLDMNQLEQAVLTDHCRWWLRSAAQQDAEMEELFGSTQF
ncbi:MAG: hypothetical protein RJA44_2543, partial [Pseudomonadota bacterium]